MPKIVCPCCRKKLHPPDHLAGRRIMCPRCDTVVVVPKELAETVDEAAAAAEPASCEEDLPFPTSARLGIIALVLGLVSNLILCLPFTNYLSTGLSSVGLLLGLGGLFRLRTDNEPLPPAVAGGVGIWGGFGTRTRDYPLAGLAACLIALILAHLPNLLAWMLAKPSP